MTHNFRMRLSRNANRVVNPERGTKSKSTSSGCTDESLDGRRPPLLRDTLAHRRKPETRKRMPKGWIKRMQRIDIPRGKTQSLTWRNRGTARPPRPASDRTPAQTPERENTEPHKCISRQMCKQHANEQQKHARKSDRNNETGIRSEAQDRANRTGTITTPSWSSSYFRNSPPCCSR